MRNLLIGVVAGVIGICLLVPALVGLGSWDRPEVNEIGLSYSGGPFEGVHFQGIQQPGSGGQFQGIQDKLVKLPANQRTYTVGTGAAADQGPITASNDEGVNATYETITYFELNADPDVLREFYEKVCTKYDDCYDEEGTNDDGWGLMLQDNLGRTEETALQSQTREFTTDELKQDDLTPIQEAVSTAMTEKVNSNLGGKYFTDIRFSINKVDFNNTIDSRYDEIKAAELKTQTKKEEVEQAEQTALAAQKLNEQGSLSDNYIDYLNAQANQKAAESGQERIVVIPSGTPVNVNTGQ